MNSQTTTKTRTSIKLAVPALMVLAALASVSCEDSDPIAPENSTITLTASPDPIDLLQGNTSTITARIFSQAGVPVPDGTAVFFETSAGQLSVTTATTSNGAGEAITILTMQSSGSASVKAFSGGVNATRNVTAVTGTVGTVTLTSPDPTIHLQCTGSINISGVVLTTTGTGVPNQTPTISVVSTSAAGLGVNSSVTSTAANGSYSGTAAFAPQQACTDNCTGGKSCTVTIKATVLGKDSAQNLIIGEDIP